MTKKSEKKEKSASTDQIRRPKQVIRDQQDFNRVIVIGQGHVLEAVKGAVRVGVEQLKKTIETFHFVHGVCFGDFTGHGWVGQDLFYGVLVSAGGMAQDEFTLVFNDLAQVFFDGLGQNKLPYFILEKGRTSQNNHLDN
jgi:hypothetical protein